MKKFNANNLYESPYPPTNTNVLWVDKDETAGEIRAIHKYNSTKGEWEPTMVGVNYLKNEKPGIGEGGTGSGNLNTFSDVYFQLPTGTDATTKQQIKQGLIEKNFDGSMVDSTTPVLVASRQVAYQTVTLMRNIHESFETAALLGPCFKIVIS